MDPRSAESEGRDPPSVRADGQVRDPLESWTRKDGALVGTFGIQDTAVAGAGLALEVGEVGQAGVATQVKAR